MPKTMTTAQAKDFAFTLYCQSTPTKEIAERVGTTERTVQRWAEAGAWATMRDGLTTARTQQLMLLQAQLTKIMTDVNSRTEPITKEELSILKTLTASMKVIDNRTGISEIVPLMISFTDFIRKYFPELPVAKITEAIDAFIKTQTNQ